MNTPLNVWRPHTLKGLELTAYEGRNRTFPPSLLTGYNFGVRLQGVRETTYRRDRFRSGPGTFLAYTPGVALAAKPVSGEAWRHIDMTLTPASLGTLLGTDPSELEKTSLRGTVSAGLNDELYTRFVTSHASFRYGAPRLEQETELLGWLEPLFEHAATRDRASGREHRAVKLVKDYLHTHAAQDVGLDALGDLTGLSKTYLLRVFKLEVGLTPYRYQMGLRLARAKTLLERGVPLSQVAVEIGLYDQSALNRLFKRHLFITPGQYQAVVRSES